MTSPDPEHLRRPDAGMPLHPALLGQAMRALHHRPPAQLGASMERRTIEAAMFPHDWGAWETLTALSEYGLVELIPARAHTSVPDRVRLTRTGRAWTPAPEGSTEIWDDEPMRFAYRRSGVLTVGTLTDWAHAWEQQHYSGEGAPGTALRTWANPYPGYTVIVDRLSAVAGDEDGYISYRVWAAGATVPARVAGGV